MSATVQPSWRFIEKVACTQCDAPAGERCQSPKGSAAPPHGKRRADAAAAGVWVPGAEVQPE
jgi:hypothetical protein